MALQAQISSSSPFRRDFPFQPAKAQARRNVDSRIDHKLNSPGTTDPDHLAGDLLQYSLEPGVDIDKPVGPARDQARVAILVVEDDDALRLSLTTILGARGFSLGEAEGVDEALAALDQRSYDILLTDLRLGEREAVELLEKLPGLAPKTRPILMSAFASARDYQAAMALSAVTVLCKPFTPEELFEAIQRAIECETGFRGSVHGLALTDMLQMFHYARRSVVIDVSYGTGKANGRIFLEEGQVVHAETEGMTGEPALQSLLAAKTGALATSALVDKVERTIFRDLQALLLDLLRLNDEKARFGDDGETKELGRILDEKEIESTSLLTERRKNAMATEKELQDTLTRIEGEISGFIAASIVDLESGMTLAARSTRGDFDLAAASAYNSEMVKQKLKIIRVLNLKSSLEDMLLTLSDQLHLIKIISPATFIYMAVDKAATNLAIARSVVNRNVANLK